MAFSIKRRRKRARIALQRLETLAVRPDDEATPAYSRSAFGHGWSDEDGDGQNARAEVLIAAHRTGRNKVEIEFATDRERRVVAGRWRCRFTGDWHTDAGDLDIDHLVPLAEAWESGAHAWDAERRKRYSNGVGVMSWKRSWLLPVTASANREKGAKRPDEWVPDNEQYRLNYAADWIATKTYWGMSVVQSEKDALIRLLLAEPVQTETPSREAAIDAAVKAFTGRRTTQGKPYVTDLERILGFDITAAERDAAWKRTR